MMENKERRNKWLVAQEVEEQHHNIEVENFNQFYEHYFDTYRQYFEWLGMSFDLERKSVVEFGGGPFPALPYCVNYNKSCILDPIAYKTYPILLDGRQFLHHIQTIPSGDYDEAWLFNCLQHVEDPKVILQWCVNHCATVRFFEPINLPTDEMHLHTLTLELFQEFFGDSVKIYPATNQVKNFHTAQCAYGSFIR